jgi:hypothetical protein
VLIFGSIELIKAPVREDRKTTVKVTVHSFELWDDKLGCYLLVSAKMTAQQIKRLRKAKVVSGTAEVIEESKLEPDGSYDPNKHSYKGC